MPGEGPRSARLVMIVAGEASGDQHGAGLVREVLARDPTVHFFGLAGPEMTEAGVEPLLQVSEVTVVGLLEVVRHLPRIYKAYRKLLRAMRSRRPDLAIFIDYPDFNLKLARKGKQLGLPVLYFVSPQVWAWRADRIRTIASRVDRMMVLFRFEEELYRAAGVQVTWVGHPLADRPASADPYSAERMEARSRLGLPAEATVIALLPGSRPGEIKRILPVMLEASRILSIERPEARFLVPAAPTLDEAELQTRCSGYPVRVVTGELRGVLVAADAAAVASGTATLEVALAGTPMVIVYKVSPLTAFIGRRLITVRDIGLANLVAGHRVAEELVQEACTPERIVGSLRWLLEPQAAESSRRMLSGVRRGLGEAGALARAAEVTLGMLDGSLAAGESGTV